MAAPFHSVESQVRPFRWKRYVILASVVSAILLGIRLNGCVAGFFLEGTSAFSLVIPFCLTLLVLVPLLLVRTAIGFYRIGQGREPWRKAGLLAIPFLAFLSIPCLPIPTFEEAGAMTIQRKASSAELSSLARSMVDHPPSWLKEAGSFSPAEQQWISSTPPLDRMGLSSYPRVLVEKDTLQFHWGSPIAQRWGIAICSVPGVKPELPAGLASSLAIYPDVWIFTLYD